MPSDTLALLDEIVKGAEAASGKGAGQPLRAAEWNALADAIARLARLAAAREKNETDALATTYARIDHQHLGAVGLTWFDAPTRALVEGRSGAADVAARLNDLARDTKGCATILRRSPVRSTVCATGCAARPTLSSLETVRRRRWAIGSTA